MIKKHLKFFSLLTLLIFFLTACAKKEENKSIESKENKEETMNFEGKTLNIIAKNEDYIPLFEAFHEKTGADIELLSMSEEEVIAKTKAEGKAIADIWFGEGLSGFLSADANGLLEHYVSKNSEDVDIQYKDANGAWITKSIRLGGFVVNKPLLEEKGLPIPKTWKELQEPMYKSEIIMSNPAMSETIYSVIKGLIDQFGEEEAWKLLDGINTNIEFYTKTDEDAQEKTIQGEFGIGIIPINNKTFQALHDSNLTLVYPEDGIAWFPELVGIFKNSENLDLAKSFIDFMLTEDSQKMITEIEGSELNLPKDKLIKEDLGTFISSRGEILQKFETMAADKLIK